MSFVSACHKCWREIHATNRRQERHVVVYDEKVKKKKVNQSHYRPEVPRGFQEVKVPRLRDNDPEWW